MNNRTSLYMHLLLAVIVVTEMTGRLTGQIGLEYLVKPLIMIWMGAYFLMFRKKKQFTIPVLVAFFFSWTGDILLMFSSRNELFFYAGVGGFFLSQIAYINVFARYCETRVRGYLQRNLFTGVYFLAYVAGIYIILLPGLEGIMKPVILVYALTLIGMSMMALNRKYRVRETTFVPVFAGSLLFVISDSLLALNKFFAEIPLAGFWIMLTYIAAQYLITRGLVREEEA